MTSAPAPPRPRNDVAREVFRGLAQRYDRLGALLSLGQDRRWRRELVAGVAAARPANVLDVATGPAGIALGIATASDAHVVGVDLNEPMLREGVVNARAAGLSDRVRLAVARGEQLPFRDEAFDGVSFSYLLRYVDDPSSTIAELARCVRPGGTMACLEFHVPPNPFWRLMWRLYTRVVLPVLGLLTGGRPWYRVGRFLGPSIEDLYASHPLNAQVAAWRAAGMCDVGWRVMSLGGGVVMWGRKEATGS